jgi:hypothetical protein
VLCSLNILGIIVFFPFLSTGMFVLWLSQLVDVYQHLKGDLLNASKGSVWEVECLLTCIVGVQVSESCHAEFGLRVARGN